MTHSIYLGSLSNLSRGPASLMELWQVASFPILCWHMIPYSHCEEQQLVLYSNVVACSRTQTIDYHTVAPAVSLTLCLISNMGKNPKTNFLWVLIACIMNLRFIMYKYNIIACMLNFLRFFISQMDNDSQKQHEIKSTMKISTYTVQLGKNVHSRRVSTRSAIYLVIIMNTHIL